MPGMNQLLATPRLPHIHTTGKIPRCFAMKANLISIPSQSKRGPFGMSRSTDALRSVRTPYLGVRKPAADHQDDRATFILSQLVEQIYKLCYLTPIVMVADKEKPGAIQPDEPRADKLDRSKTAIQPAGRRQATRVIKAHSSLPNSPRRLDKWSLSFRFPTFSAA